MVGEREIIYLSLRCHHQNDSCIKMGSDESHFNVSVGSDGQSHKTVSTDHNFKAARSCTGPIYLPSWSRRTGCTFVEQAYYKLPVFSSSVLVGEEGAAVVK